MPAPAVGQHCNLSAALRGLLEPCARITGTHGSEGVRCSNAPHLPDLVGEFKNSGRQWRPAGDPAPVHVHDFADPELGKAIPYGVYDLAANTGWINVGTDHDTAAFAVESIRSWWHGQGQTAYPQATRVLITADAAWIQRLPNPGLEARTCPTRRRDGPDHHCLSSAAGHIEGRVAGGIHTLRLPQIRT